MQGREGLITEEGVDHLRWLWLAVDPSFSLLSTVVAELNEFYEQQQAKFERFFPGCRWIARLISWDFGVLEADVRHALNHFDPPDERVVKLFGVVDVGKYLAKLPPLSFAGSTHVRVHLVVLANRLWRSPAAAPLQPQRARSRQTLAEPPVPQWRRIFTLYHSIVVVKYAPHVVSFLLAQYILQRLYKTECVQRTRQALVGMQCVQFIVAANPRIVEWAGKVEQGVFGMPPEGEGRGTNLVSFVLGVLVCLWLIPMLNAYKEVMLPRQAMLIVNTHRSLVEMGYLLPGDYSEFRGVLS